MRTAGSRSRYVREGCRQEHLSILASPVSPWCSQVPVTPPMPLCQSPTFLPQPNNSQSPLFLVPLCESRRVSLSLGLKVR